MSVKKRRLDHYDYLDDLSSWNLAAMVLQNVLAVGCLLYGIVKPQPYVFGLGTILWFDLRLHTLQFMLHSKR